MLDYQDTGWRYWLVTAIFLTFGMFHDAWWFLAAMGLTVVQLVHYTVLKGGVSAFSVQVRYWYLLLLIVSFPEFMRWLYWLPFVGTWAQVVFGYCAMARFVSLLPWNRKEKFSWRLVVKTFFARPVRGSVQQKFSVASPSTSS